MITLLQLMIEIGVVLGHAMVLLENHGGSVVGAIGFKKLVGI